MKEIILIFPHQLFESNPAIGKKAQVIIIEDPLFFGDFRYPLNFHKNKIILHRASMKFYQDYLLKQGYDVKYIDYVSIKNKLKNDYLTELLKNTSAEKIHYIEPVDFILNKRIQKLSSSLKVELVEHSSPMFLTDRATLKSFFKGKQNYLMHSFYIFQRKRLNILIQNGKPIGGKWSYDYENRKKLPKNILVPKPSKLKENKYVKEAKEYVNLYFSKNLGSSENFNYPTTFQEARECFSDFIINRFYNFGYYEDAIDDKDNFLFHSILSPALNIGLITPREVINTILDYSRESDFPLNTVEGFIRQIIGWREYIRAIYEIEGVRQRNSNFFELTNKLPESFYTGTTGIVPFDDSIKKLISTAFTHHIERLMILGNFMLLSEIDPNEVYKWFMEFFIDAYDWVMVPNIYGMSQYADGGLICTKPYISSSNYILKMSNYKKGEWCKTWDSMYWSFLSKHKQKLKDNQRMSMVLKILDKIEKRNG
jgi:deoxyribodipyrimidine photolyase-related protein